MVNHVKLEIAIQLIVEKIARIYNKLDSAKTPEELELYNQELEQAFNQRELIYDGDTATINLILDENKGANLEKNLVEVGNTKMINEVLNRNIQEKNNSQPQMGE